MNTTTITKTIFLDAPRDIVWSFLTQKDKLARWFHPAEEDLKEGADYTLLDQHGDMSRICWGQVLEMRPHDSLVYTFTVKPLNGAMTTVRWTLEDAAGGTRLTLAHEGIEQAAGEAAFMMLSALDAGWDQHFGRLRQEAKALVEA
ncbi:SRPBCC domain-containing protein [uncultured Roseibium sp.]|uniref:SRPBCC family protein n=1 Tax=uncultured Roseibium sp. TaxID=1936171 RepID=UPI00262D63FB|nr:SRPBCC domain-containing protein [uncultured Roseibium sp.]